LQLISVCNSERIIKIGQYCQSYAQMKKGPVFLTRSVVIPFKHSVIRVMCSMSSVVLVFSSSFLLLSLVGSIVFILYKNVIFETTCGCSNFCLCYLMLARYLFLATVFL